MTSWNRLWMNALVSEWIWYMKNLNEKCKVKHGKMKITMSQEQKNGKEHVTSNAVFETKNL